jgi:hypothetical protein
MTPDTPITGLICSECTTVDDPAPWCDCRGDERCIGPCRKRAHDPERCPMRQAYVPHPTPWCAVKPGDVIRLRTGELMVITTRLTDGSLVATGLDMGGTVAARTLRCPSLDYPVPVLVPYAERAALLVFERDDRARRHQSEIIGRTG